MHLPKDALKTRLKNLLQMHSDPSFKLIELVTFDNYGLRYFQDMHGEPLNGTIKFK